MTYAASGCDPNGRDQNDAARPEFESIAAHGSTRDCRQIEIGDNLVAKTKKKRRRRKSRKKSPARVNLLTKAKKLAVDKKYEESSKLLFSLTRTPVKVHLQIQL